MTTGYNTLGLAEYGEQEYVQDATFVVCDFYIVLVGVSNASCHTAY